MVPTVGAPRLFAHATGAASYYGVGGVRVRFRDGDAEVANQAFASTIVGAGLIGNRWWFVSARGTVASVADYLDNVHFEHDLAAPVVRAFVHDSMLIAVLADGRVERVDGSTPPMPMLTSLVQSPDAAPLAVPEHESSVVADAALRQFPTARLALSSTAFLGNGDVAARGSTGVYFGSVASDGSLQGASRVALSADTQFDCNIHPWGARAVLTCPGTPLGDDHTIITPFVVDHDAVARVGPSMRGPIIVGREGHTLTFVGPCPERAESGSPGEDSSAPAAVEPSVTSLLACTLDRDRDWRVWEYPHPARLLDVFDATALVLETHDGAPQLRFYDIDNAHAIDVRLDDPTVDIARAGFAPDGRIVVLANAGTAHSRRSLVGIGAPGTTIGLRAIGFYVRDLDLADSRSGLAAGENAHDVAETRDGGLTWLRVDTVAVDGDPRAFALFDDAAPSSGPGRIGTEVHCTNMLCRAGAHLVHTWDRTVEIVPPMP